MKSDSTKEIIKKIDEKCNSLGLDKNNHLEGLLHTKPITYWDYIQLNSLLGLQIQKTNYKDEMVFIVYHQINELIFKMILWELQQVAEETILKVSFFEEKLMRISRYFDMLTSSFIIMQEGMDVAQYNKFRHALAPGSGFQSAQYRKIEFASTELINLIDPRYRKTIDRDTPFEHALEHLYWQAAGKDYKTNNKSILLTSFESEYKEEFITFMKVYNTKNLWSRFKDLPSLKRKNKSLIKAMRHYDYTVNIKWVKGHYNAAKHYISSNSNNEIEGTGGSNWQKYMHPKYQKRIFFPELWSSKEKDNWGHEVEN
ncbi:MAG: tryptophan 2,3-dioxygenase [Flavobacteriaceae bacterium]|nr:tryptophan 2,3-dioxygenase [Flavobacteriaceae bacterium]|tara:strand:+ start:1474 stop:2412 length:939 start_codon:yes stop_codon:yes gene_type:complete